MGQRIRTLKPSFWSSPDVVRMGHEARLLMVGLMSYADDDGRFIASESAIIGYVYPYDRINVVSFRKWFLETQESMVHLYEVEGLLYGCIPSWHNHQRINRYTQSLLPEPDIDCALRNQNKGDDE